MEKTVKEIIQETCEDICDNYCKYRETSDEECLCVVIRTSGTCPLDRISI